MLSSRSVATTAAILLLLSGCSGEVTKKPDTLPELELPVLTDEGVSPERINLSQVEGPALVNVWASWCKPCIKEMPIAQDFHEKHPSINMIGINYSESDPSRARDLLRSTGVSYQVVYDKTGDINNSGAFPRVAAMPIWMVLDKQGRVSFSEFVVVDTVKDLEEMVADAVPGALESTDEVVR